MDLGLRGRTAVIGGATSGLGRASAEALAAQFPVEIARVAPTIAGLTTQRLVLIVAEDYVEAIGATR